MKPVQKRWNNMLTPFENYNREAFRESTTPEEYYEFSGTYSYRESFRSWEDYDKRDNFIEEYSEREY